MPRPDPPSSETPDTLVWRYVGVTVDPYKHEQNLLFAAISDDQLNNETGRAAKACLAAIMDRMGTESCFEVSYSTSPSRRRGFWPALNSQA